MADHLVAQVAACIWRLRRVPEIEARVYKYFRHLQERNEAEKRVNSFLVQVYPDSKQITAIRDPEAHKAAMEVQQRADAKLLEDEPLMGRMFAEAERSLTSLVRIAGAIESSMYRAIRELERIKAERPTATNDNSVTDVEPDEGVHPDGQAPSSRAETINAAVDLQHTQPATMDTMEP